MWPSPSSTHCTTVVLNRTWSLSITWNHLVGSARGSGTSNVALKSLLHTGHTFGVIAGAHCCCTRKTRRRIYHKANAKNKEKSNAVSMFIWYLQYAMIERRTTKRKRQQYYTSPTTQTFLRQRWIDSVGRIRLFVQDKNIESNHRYQVLRYIPQRGTAGYERKWGPVLGTMRVQAWFEVIYQVQYISRLRTVKQQQETKKTMSYQ